jgi:hypothetical protein
MPPPYHIRYMPRQEIDPLKWETCIGQSPNGLIYGSLSYLDGMAPHWDALILGDYEAVMPLTWNKKWGIRYLYQPPLTPQLGVFSPQPITEDLVTAFLQQAISHFKFAEIYLNFANRIPGLRPFTNIVLDLNAPYEVVRANYKKDLEKNLRRAAGFSLQYGPSSDVDGAIDLYREYYAAKTPHVTASDYRRFTGFCHSVLHSDSVLIRTVFPGKADGYQGLEHAAKGILSKNEDIQSKAKSIPSKGIPSKDDPANRLGHSQFPMATNQPPLALALLLKKKNRLCLLMSVCPPAGRKVEANHFLLDSLIREFAGTGFLLDFDGSEIPGVAHFYSNFGGVDQPFFFYRYNRLPWPLRLFKPADSQPSGNRQ